MGSFLTHTLANEKQYLYVAFNLNSAFDVTAEKLKAPTRYRSQIFDHIHKTSINSASGEWSTTCCSAFHPIARLAYSFTVQRYDDNKTINSHFCSVFVIRKTLERYQIAYYS